VIRLPAVTLKKEIDEEVTITVHNHYRLLVSTDNSSG
jgi:hypothetical protein